MSFFSRAYRYFAARRFLLFSTTVALLVLSAALCAGLHMQADIATMLPDRGSAVTADFKLLQEAPFARKLVITVTAGLGVDSSGLAAATDRLAAALDPRLFRHVASGPGVALQQRLMPWLLAAAPNLMSRSDLATLRAKLKGDGVRKRIRADYEALLGPEGWALEEPHPPRPPRSAAAGP